MKLTPIREIDVLAASSEFQEVFGEDKGWALAVVMGKVQRDPMVAPRAIADLQLAGFTRPQAEEVVRQTIIGVTGKKPPLELFAGCGIVPQSAA